ncbi:XRE family transcriptional regulator [Allopusillimonas soli]|uniref:XRE family transcriptional regulator n=1 Tax=Allopusillimonas soli TaxID=659016 RepID=A0A853F679_9BURK|nr:XRE family transcriptional regulator [Allopusillimonas soli]NYT36065.1 XRE family transcriptional regulator [Allopusillimonas soli]TEA76404.1 XRE family transcriptional regulator [Allopusillimonas soli]
MITGAQCCAARALVEVTIAKLARRSGVDARTIESFEQKADEPDSGTIQLLQSTLEDLGAVFIPENGGGAGVRLRFSRSETKQIGRLENEGGMPGSNTVP